jgi:hypothetical protein
VTVADEEPTYACAIWYLDNQSQIGYELYEREEEAAHDAAVYDGDWTIFGMQRADGTTVAADLWSKFQEAKDRLRQQRAHWGQEWPLRPEVRRSKDPFRGYVLGIDATEPGWLGARAGKA